MRAFDILPPKHPRTKAERKEAKRSKKKVNILFMLFLFAIIAFFIAFLGSDKYLGTPATFISVSSNPVISSTLSPSPTFTLKILNGSGRFEVADTVARKVNAAGYKVTMSENALNLYDKSVIYYTADEEKKAIEIQNILKEYQPSIQKFTAESRYNIVIVIGTN